MLHSAETFFTSIKFIRIKRSRCLGASMRNNARKYWKNGISKSLGNSGRGAMVMYSSPLSSSMPHPIFMLSNVSLSRKPWRIPSLKHISHNKPKLWAHSITPMLSGLKAALQVLIMLTQTVAGTSSWCNTVIWVIFSNIRPSCLGKCSPSPRAYGFWIKF